MNDVNSCLTPTAIAWRYAFHPGLMGSALAALDRKHQAALHAADARRTAADAPFRESTRDGAPSRPNRPR